MQIRPVDAFVPGEALVRLKPGMHAEEVQDLAILRRFALPDKAAAGGGDLLHVRLPDGVSLEGLARDPRVQYAAPNHLLQALEPPVVPDDLDPRLWGLKDHDESNGRADIRAPEAWGTIRSSDPGPVIAVIDSGIDLTHPDLRANLWSNPREIAGNGLDDDGNGVVDDVHGYNAITKSGDPSDDNRHGTHCAGTIGAEGDNGQGVVGVNWSARMMGVKFLSAGGMGTTADAIDGLLYADRMGARITSNSWGGGPYNQAMKDVLASTQALHVFAAGNSSNDSDLSPAYPASYDLPNLISVAASTDGDTLASFSNRGLFSVDLAAPGERIFSTLPGGQYGSLSGTSMAAPHVSGAAALILARYPELTNAELKDRLLFGVDRNPALEGTCVSGGRLNLERSLEDDTVAPSAVTGTAAEGVSPSRAVVRWNAGGDDGDVGRAAAFELRVSLAPIQDFDQARPLPVGPPGDPGAAHEAALELLPSGRERTVHFALRAVDNVGNRSAIVTAEAVVPAARVAFEDDGERPDVPWTVEGSWGLREAGHRGHVWSDSPAGEYRNDTHASLTSPPIDLQGLRNPTLAFEARHELEINFDKVFLEISPDGGQTWSGLETFNLKSGWKLHTYDLSAYEGGTVQIRFRLKTDADVTMDGFEFDNLVVFGQEQSSLASPATTP